MNIQGNYIIEDLNMATNIERVLDKREAQLFYRK